MSRIKYLIKRANLPLYIHKIPGVMLVINQHALITHGREILSHLSPVYGTVPVLLEQVTSRSNQFRSNQCLYAPCIIAKVREPALVYHSANVVDEFTTLHGGRKFFTEFAKLFFFFLFSNGSVSVRDPLFVNFSIRQIKERERMKN